MLRDQDRDKIIENHKNRSRQNLETQSLQYVVQFYVFIPKFSFGLKLIKLPHQSYIGQVYKKNTNSFDFVQPCSYNLDKLIPNSSDLQNFSTPIALSHIFVNLDTHFKKV